MKTFTRFVDSLTTVFRWFGLCFLVSMMLLISIAVIMRWLKYSLPADVELVVLAMGAVVMFGLAYTQKVHSHISVGLLVDNFSIRWQAAADILTAILTFSVCALIAWANLNVAIDYATTSPTSTDYLSIPLWPFKLIVSLGFFLWGLQAIMDIPSILKTVRDDHDFCHPGETS